MFTNMINCPLGDSRLLEAVHWFLQRYGFINYGVFKDIGKTLVIVHGGTYGIGHPNLSYPPIVPPAYT